MILDFRFQPHGAKAYFVIADFVIRQPRLP